MGWMLVQMIALATYSESDEYVPNTYSTSDVTGGDTTIIVYIKCEQEYVTYSEEAFPEQPAFKEEAEQAEPKNAIHQYRVAPAGIGPGAFKQRPRRLPSTYG